MALFLCSFQNITRSEGRSAVAAAAYRAGEKVTNRWDGVTHDYTKKQGVVHTEILLPPEAPAEYLFRDRLWNAVEAAEKSTNARLCRECLLALPTELNWEQQIQLVRDFVEQNFVALGMCADVAIHDPQGRETENPHAHILLTVRPINEHGKWEPKSQVEYRCKRGNEEHGFTAAEFRDAAHEGWEKQYKYKTHGKKQWLTPSQAEAQGLTSADRVGRTPRTTPHGRENPTAARWNSPEQLCQWRENWARCVNQKFMELGLPQRVDHRSYAAQGREEIPGIHTGPHPGENVREINAAVMKFNSALHEYQKIESALRTKLAETKRDLQERQQKLAANQLSTNALNRSIQDLNRIAEQESDAAEKAQSTLELLNAVTGDTLKTIAALEQALEGLGRLQFGQRKELLEQLEAVQQKLNNQTTYLRTQLSQTGLTDQRSIDAAKAEVMQRHRELTNLTENLLQLEAEAEQIRQQITDTVAQVPEQFQNEVLAREVPKEEKRQDRPPRGL